MVLMNAGKKARHAASISNSTKIYGIMGGNVTSVGRRASIQSAYNRAPTNSGIPAIYDFYPRPTGPNRTKNISRNAYMYMERKKMLSVNPVTGIIGWGMPKPSRA
jgi:hypothetical protein